MAPRPSARTESAIQPTTFLPCEPESELRPFDVPRLGIAPDVSGLSHWAEEPSESRAPQRLGLDAYDVVPDDHAGPLGPGQIRASQRATLDRYRFDSLDVVGDNHQGSLARGQMRQAEYEQLQSAWLTITSGQGMTMSGRPRDREAWLQMIRTGIGNSSTLRETVSTIGNDPDPTHAIHADLGRRQELSETPAANPGVFIDQFDSDQIDLHDLSRLPETPRARHPNDITQTEMITHILAERREAALTGNARTTNTSVFDQMHFAAQATQNRVRDEFGQTHLYDAVSRQHANDDGIDGRFIFVDGTEQIIPTNSNNDIRRQPR